MEHHRHAFKIKGGGWLFSQGLHIQIEGIYHMDVKKWLMDWFEKNAVLEESGAENNIRANYFDRGWIDSFGFITLITEIEKTFGIRFSNDEFQNRSFSTMAGLAEIIQ